MTNVTLNPSEEVVKASAAEVTVTDSRGRSISLKKPNLLSQYRLVEILGEAGDYNAYRTMCLPLIYVSAIDGEAVFQPANKRELEALIQRLDEDGLIAINEGLQKHFQARTEEAEKEAIKK